MLGVRSQGSLETVLGADLKRTTHGSDSHACSVVHYKEAPVPQGPGGVKRQEEESSQRKYSAYWSEVGQEQEAPVHPLHFPARTPPTVQRRIPKEHPHLKAHTQETYPTGSECEDDNNLQTCHMGVADDEAHKYHGYHEGAEQPKGEDAARDNL
ncbi:hypothetical protein Emag_006056 [Eimeria magna]